MGARNTFSWRIASKARVRSCTLFSAPVIRLRCLFRYLRCASRDCAAERVCPRDTQARDKRAKHRDVLHHLSLRARQCCMRDGSPAAENVSTALLHGRICTRCHNAPVTNEKSDETCSGTALARCTPFLCVHAERELRAPRPAPGCPRCCCSASQQRNSISTMLHQMSVHSYAMKSRHQLLFSFLCGCGDPVHSGGDLPTNLDAA